MESLLHVFTLVSEACLLQARTNTAIWVPHLFLYGRHYIRASSFLGKQGLSMCLSESNCMGHWLLRTTLTSVLKRERQLTRPSPLPFLISLFSSYFHKCEKATFFRISCPELLRSLLLWRLSKLSWTLSCENCSR